MVLSKRSRRWTMACLFRVFLLLILIVAIGLVELASRLRSQEEPLTIESSLDRDDFRGARDVPIINSKRSRQQVKVYYSTSRRDRYGGALQDMLFAHAYSYQRKAEYGGACGNEDRTPQHRQLIQELGLFRELKFACPAFNNSQVSPILQREVYYLQDTAIWTPEWVDYIRSKVKYPPRDNNVFHMAVHIRRGDVNLCDSELNFRYLPNAHYLQLIQDYMPNKKNVKVTIFSEPDDHALEPWTDFTSKNYTLQLGTDISSVWKSLMMADILIMSKSSFSLVPAMLNRHGTIVYTPFWHEPLQHWKIVSDAQIEASRVEMKRLEKQKCNWKGVHSH